MRLPICNAALSLGSALLNAHVMLTFSLTHHQRMKTIFEPPLNKDWYVAMETITSIKC